MKLNNKGFAISSIMYIILVLAVVLISLILVTLSSRKLILDKLREEVLTTIYEAPKVTYRQTIKELKNEMINYMSNNSLEKESVKVSDLNSSIDSDALEKYELSDKYLTAVQNENLYNVYLGKTSTISNTSELPKNTLDIIDYKIYGNSFQVMLPEKYQEVEYIESTGTQYIDTGIIPDQNTGFDIIFLSKNQISSVSGEYGSIMGARKASNSLEFQLTTYKAGTGYYGVFRFKTGNNNAGITPNEKMNVTFKNGVYSNNNDVEFTLDATTFTAPSSLTIFAVNENGEIKQNGSLQLYNLKLYNGNSLIRNFIPCYRKADNEIGLYDVVNEVFYVNSGTGEFLKGKDIESIPTPQNPIEIKSVGDKTKNLINKENAVAGYYINSSGNKVSTVSYGLMVTEKIYVKPSTSYTYSGMGNVAETTVGRTGYQYDENDNPITHIASSIGGDVVFTTASNCTYILLQYKKESETPILVEGVQSINYEPYGYKIPVKVSGKNLFNSNLEQGYISSTGENAGTIANIRSIGIISINENATLSFETDIQTQRISFCYYEDGVFTRRVETSTTNKYLTTDLQGNENGIRFYITSLDAVTMTSSDFTNVQLELGTKATDYEPYVEPITTNIYLDEPLRKIGTYDDYIVFQNNKVVRSIRMITHDGSQNYNYTTYAFLSYVENQLDNNSLIMGLNSHYRSYPYDELYSIRQNENTQGFAIAGKLRIIDNINFGSDTTKFKSWVLEQNNKGTPMKSSYVLATPTEEIIELQKINTSIGATQISIDASIEPSNYEFTVIEKIIEI